MRITPQTSNIFKSVYFKWKKITRASRIPVICYKKIGWKKSRGKHLGENTKEAKYLGGKISGETRRVDKNKWGKDLREKGLGWNNRDEKDRRGEKQMGKDR